MSGITEEMLMAEALAAKGQRVRETSASEPQALAVIDKGTALPIFRGAEMSEALTAYRELQKALDAAMPDQIMTLEGKPFRKKGYWRAIAVAFNLRTDCVRETQETDGSFTDGHPNFGWHVVYRATASNGRCATGDGSCCAVEKARRRDDADPWATLPAQASQHNVRAHAHTRAFNRAVSNLVGFGEVSAEEIERDAPTRHGEAPPLATASGTPAAAPVGPAPDGYAYIRAYQCRNGWHEVAIDDASGGHLILSTKLAVGLRAKDAYHKGLPVKVEWKPKPDGRGGYLNGVEVWTPPAEEAASDEPF